MVSDYTSWSEIQAWCTCRQQWWWKYEQGIVPRRTRRAPSLGSCGHEALRAYYSGLSWEAAVDEWLNVQLETPCFDEEIQEIQETATTVRNIITRYIQHYTGEGWSPVHNEQKFDIPITGLKKRFIGYWDNIIQDPDGHLWLVETKFPSQFRDEDSCLLDGQIGVYQWAAYRSGFHITGTIYNQILAKEPATPKLNKDGSLSRAKIATTWEVYKQTVVDAGQKPEDYAEMKDKLSEFEFFRRYYIFRNLPEIRRFTRDMERRVWDLSRIKKHIYRCGSILTCRMCDYKELCIESLKGGDVNGLIESAFEPKNNKGREGS